MDCARTCASLAIALCLALFACDEGAPSRGGIPRDTSPYRSKVEEGPGAAVVLLIDTSGSMNESVPGSAEKKWRVARDAVEQVLQATEIFTAQHPTHRIKVGVMHFSDRPNKILPVSDYDRERLRVALARVPRPSGGTAIGTSLDAARRELYRSGCFRKYILAVTDGENTDGTAPDVIAREIHARSEGGVRIYFVAFDTDPENFAFLREVGGDVLSAKSGAQLQAALKEIYEGRILAEALDDAATAPTDRR